MSDKKPVDFIEQIKYALGFTGAFTSVSYVFGFIIINSFLTSYGAVSYSALNTKYLAVGVCFMIFYATVAIMFLKVVHGKGHTELFEDFKKRSWPVQIGFQIFWACVYFAIFFVIMLAVFWSSSSDMSLFRDPKLYLWLPISSIGLSLLIDLINRAHRRWFLVFLITVSMLFSAIMYGRIIYPFVSASIGGGCPRCVQFILEEDNPNITCDMLGEPEACRTTKPLMLIAETGEHFLVKIEKYLLVPFDRNGKAFEFINIDTSFQIVQMKKALIRGIIYPIADSPDTLTYLSWHKPVKEFQVSSNRMKQMKK